MSEVASPETLKAMTPKEVDKILDSAMMKEQKAKAVLERNERAIRTWGANVEEWSDPKIVATNPAFWNSRLLDYRGRIEMARGEVEETLPLLAAARKIIKMCDEEHRSRQLQR